MWIPSKFNVLYLLVALMSIEQSASSWQLGDSSHDLCKDKDHDDFELQLRAAMLFRKCLILIDEGWNVYQVPHSSMNNSYSQLLIDIVSQPIEQYWPAFAKLDNWTRVKPKVTAIYHVDVKIPYLYMTVIGEAKGLCFNLDTQDFETGGPVYTPVDKEPRISDNGPMRFTIKQYYSHMFLINWNLTWYSDGRLRKVLALPMGFMYYTWNLSTPHLLNITVIDYKVANESQVIPAGFGIRDVAWKLIPGFLYQENFHFFDYKDVYTFPISPLKLVNYTAIDAAPIRASNPIKITKVKDYFQCVHLNLTSATYPPDPYSLNPGTASSGTANWIWIVVAVVVLLLIGAIIALLVWYFVLGSKSAKSKSKKAKTSSVPVSASRKDGESNATRNQNASSNQKIK